MPYISQTCYIATRFTAVHTELTSVNGLHTQASGTNPDKAQIKRTANPRFRGSRVRLVCVCCACAVRLTRTHAGHKKTASPVQVKPSY
jgi:hypothetical protein